MGKLPTVRPIPSQPQPQIAPSPALFASPPPGPATWQHVGRTIVNPASNTVPSIFLPGNANHACMIWRASDTSANTIATYGGLQLSVSGVLDNTLGHYNWTDWQVNDNAGVLGSGANGAPAAGDIAWSSIMSTGGGTGQRFWSRGSIYLPFYSQADSQAVAYWDFAQINNGTIARRIGAGYLNGAQGPVTALSFFLTGGLNFAAGSMFDLFVSV